MFNESPFTGACAYSLIEVLAMLFGTLLLGLLLGFLIWGWLKKRVRMLERESVTLRRIADLRHMRTVQLSALITSLKEQLERTETRISVSEYKLRRAHEDVDALHAQINALHLPERLIESELPDVIPKSNKTAVPADTEPTLAEISHAMDTGKNEVFVSGDNASGSPAPDATLRTGEYLESASHIIGKAVFENDLLIIIGIDPPLRQKLYDRGIKTWTELAQAPEDIILGIASGIEGASLKHEPKTWIIQARMASKGEWRKLKVYRETLQ